jgi:hypothetical protein
MAKVLQPRGKIFQSLGIVRGPEQWLFPEEAAFLVDRGSADLLIGGVAASVERCFALLLHENVSMEDFYAYAYLRRLGYHVRRSLAEPLTTLAIPHPPSRDQEGVFFRYDVWPPGSFKRSMPGIPLFRAIIVAFDHPVWTAAQMRRLAIAAEPSTARIIAVERSTVTIFEVRSQGPLAKPADPKELWLAERARAQQRHDGRADPDETPAAARVAASDMDSEDDLFGDTVLSGSEHDESYEAETRSVSSESSKSN